VLRKLEALDVFVAEADVSDYDSTSATDTDATAGSNSAQRLKQIAATLTIKGKQLLGNCICGLVAWFALTLAIV
jgi:hypothetical protein